MANTETIILDDNGTNKIKILTGKWRNFKGEKRRFNNAGDRSFNIGIYDDDILALLESKGVNIKTYISSNTSEDMDPLRYLKVKVNFNEYGPKVYLYVEGKEEPVQLDSETVGELDEAFITRCIIKLNLRPYSLDTGASGVSVYLNELAVQIKPNRFETNPF